MLVYAKKDLFIDRIGNITALPKSRSEATRLCRAREPMYRAPFRVCKFDFFMFFVIF